MNSPMGIEDSEDSPRSTSRPGSAASREALAVPPSYLRLDDDSDTDSAYGEDSLLRDDTRTLATYMTEYRYEFGRRYHAFRDGAYWGPNDDLANEQQEIAHHMYCLTLDAVSSVSRPISNPPRFQEILDVGTGTGQWAIDMADEYPSARVTGVDLSPIQPSFVPPNCTFEIDDMTLPWTYDSHRFDFIHVRELFGSIPDWDEFFQQCLRALKPGGYIEVVEHSVDPVADDATMGPNHFFRVWGETVLQAGQRFGKSFSIWQESAERLRTTGFEEVEEHRYQWPMNGWSDDRKLHELGRWNQFRLHGGLETFMLRLLTSTLEWPYSQAQVFLARMRVSLRDYRTHAYLPLTVVTARKPLSASSQS
ncbi:S-adenosyl-L-methionine-dependent methyltransferase [Penicillium alfredii]|uniref:S-adenosyl-L-methionine-dependent methyltransferase n=1 Tax=Penicillium alfredii TaxID=1506179 RepID=A0A9W9EGD0_9EURO|nr:S-adenosyl-L-methionine-dependent methyltransferase [Penicillium alfredii]KAJ5081276.1 S-adenosyl-L-methionine-dependent methyltransferase [Penicillium alfredii]